MPAQPARRLACTAVGASVAVYAFLLFRTAWLCDDAFITFRSVDHLLLGYGPVWNVAERVQAFTHPLWLALLAAAAAPTRELYFTPLLLQVAASLAAVGLLCFRIATVPGAALLGAWICIGSKAFVDYSTSGLENPLSHLLLLLGYRALATAPQRPARVGLLVSALLLTRTDFALLLAPALVLWLRPRAGAARALARFALGLAPLVLWHAFALFYYGSPFPNPAWAKLATGIAASDLIPQGLRYLADSLRSDPLTLPAIAAGCLASLRLGTRARALALGLLAYLAYVVWIGGDFMSGRFLSAPLIAAAALLVEACARAAPRWQAAAVAAACGLGLLAPYPNLLSGPDYGLDRGGDFRDLPRAVASIIGRDGISDERAWHYQVTGLALVRWDAGRLETPIRAHAKFQDVLRLQRSGQKLLVLGAIGLRGYFLGPEVHIVDESALADPLLSKLPTRDLRHWRIGHFVRAIPCGYLESLERDRNAIRDPGLARFYAALRRVTRGPLLGWERLREIARLNTGGYAAELAAHRNDEGCPEEARGH